MAAIQNRIVLRNISDSVFSFSGSSVISVEPVESVDIMANKLAIDVATATVEYEQGSGPDIRALPYGTPMWHYENNTLARKLYIKEIERLTRTRYKISAISPIGILDKQYHRGGIYTGKSFSELLQEIIQGAVPYTCDAEVGSVEIFGWLPYATKRDNLHQVLFAENISIVKNASGDRHFTFLRSSGTVQTIPESRIFQGSTINYPAVATQINVTEHSFQFVKSNERVTLIDNSDKSPASGKLFAFDTAPVYVGSLEASEGLTVEESGVNYAIVSGQGILTGIPYYDKKSTVTRTNQTGGSAYTVSVEDITVITGVNSENVADRMLSYYTSRETVSADVKLNGEKCGNQYSFVDKFGDTVQAYLSKIAAKISSFVRAKCEFVCGYVPQTFGNNYKYWHAMKSHAYITILPGTGMLRLLIIGGGDGGSSGLQGEDDPDDLQAGSKGGKPGTPGKGGLIREVTIRNPDPGTYECWIGDGGAGGAECSSTQASNLGTAGGRSYVITPNGTVYSTEDAAAYHSVNGVKNLVTEDVYAKKGLEGVKGGDGGRGSISGNGEPGEDVVWNGVIRKGGKGGLGLKFTFTRVEQAILNGGAGGSGAQATADGRDGESVVVGLYVDNTDAMSSDGYKAYESGKFNQACPARGLAPVYESIRANYGDGGNAGHGGAGRGGFGSANALDMCYTDPTDNKKVMIEMDVEEFDPQYYTSSNGAAGYQGARGIIVFYADRDFEVIEEVLATPELSYEGYDSVAEKLRFSWETTPPAPQFRLFYRFSTDAGFSWTGWNYYTITGGSQVTRYDIPCERGILCEAYVVSTGSPGTADSDKSNTVIAVEPASPSYAAPDLTACPLYVDSEIKALLAATVPAEGVSMMTVFRKSAGTDAWVLVGLMPYDSEDMSSYAGNTYEYKAAWISNQNRKIVSPFCNPVSVTLPQMEDALSKLVPPGNIKAEYRDMYYGGSSAFLLKVGLGDTRATDVNIYKVAVSPVLYRSMDISGVYASGSRIYQIAIPLEGYDYIPGRGYNIELKNTRSGYEDSDYCYPHLFSITVPENKLEKPAAAGSLSGDVVTLTWGAVSNAAGYKVTRWSASSQGWTDVGNVGASTFSYQTPYTADALYNGVLVYRLYASAGSGYLGSDPTRIDITP